MVALSFVVVVARFGISKGCEIVHVVMVRVSLSWDGIGPGKSVLVEEECWCLSLSS